MLDVPDGELELYLYQTNKMSELLDVTDIADNRALGPKISKKSLPERAAGIADFSYGDKREALASQSEHVAQIFDHCFGGPMDMATFDWQCWAPFEEVFIEMFGGYGLNGTIKMGNGTRVVANLVEVPFCQLLPDALNGLESNASKIALKAAAAPCADCGTCSTTRRSGLDLTRNAWVHQSLDRDPRIGPLRQAARERAASIETNVHDGGAMRSLLTVANATTTPDFSVDHWVMGSACFEHKDCMQGPLGSGAGIMGGAPFSNPGKFTDISGVRFWSGGPGQFCDITGSCDTCGWCQDDATNPIDGTCPQDLCPGSGGFPQCVDAAKMLRDFKCPERYKFEVRKYKDIVPEWPPQVALPSKVQQRFLTPFNRLVGSVLVSQTRAKATSCEAGNGTAVPGVQKKSILKYIMRDEGTSTCLGEDPDTDPYGVDSVLIPTSSIYDGKAMFSQGYNGSERADLYGVDTGFGFFNHSYDTILYKIKDSNLINEDFAEAFNVYIDSRSTLEQASNYVTYLREGGFVDEYTETLKVAFVTFNIDNNMFCLVEFEFEWTKGGGISHDWSMLTTPGPPVYRSGGVGSTHPLQFPLEVVCIILLAINCLLEFWDIVVAFRVMKAHTYFLNPWNWIDLIHFGIMWSGWVAWVNYTEQGNAFEMMTSYPGVHDPFAGVRYFQTNSTHEHAFLDFVDNVSGLAGALRNYNNLVGMSLLLFVVRIIKNLDFQERMGLVSRTIIAAIPNILHFLVLFMLVFYGYAAVGHVLFGHLFEPMSDMNEGMTFLFLTMLLGYDPIDFHAPMKHATEAWAYQIYKISFLIILFMVLCNVLLGILIDTYCELKGELDEDAPSFIPEMMDILTSNALDFLIDNKKRMPDSKLKAILDEHKAGLPSSEVLGAALAQSTAPPPSIILSGGAEIDGPTMKKLVTRHTEHKMQQNALSLQAFAGHESDDEEDHEDDVDPEEWVKLADGSLKKVAKAKEIKIYANDDEEQMILDIVSRYAHESQVEDSKKDDDELALLQVEHLKRELAMFRAAMMTHNQVIDMEDQLDRMALAVLPPEERLPKPVAFGGRSQDEGLHSQVRGLLRVTVVGARGLPAMDIMGSTDPYALVFLTEPLGDSITGAVTFRTETMVKTHEPTWNADFELPIFPHAASLTVAVFDHDSITKDDMIGVAHVHLCDLDVWVQSDKWYQLSNHKMNARRIAEAEVHLRVTRLPGGIDTSMRGGCERARDNICQFVPDA